MGFRAPLAISTPPSDLWFIVGKCWWWVEVSNLFLLSLSHSRYLPLSRLTPPDLEGFLPTKDLMGDGCVGDVWVYKAALSFDKATGLASWQCFIKRDDLWHIFFKHSQRQTHKWKLGNKRRHFTHSPMQSGYMGQEILGLRKQTTEAWSQCSWDISAQQLKNDTTSNCIGCKTRSLCNS